MAAAELHIAGNISVWTLKAKGKAGFGNRGTGNVPLKRRGADSLFQNRSVQLASPSQCCREVSAWFARNGRLAVASATPARPTPESSRRVWPEARPGRGLRGPT